MGWIYLVFGKPPYYKGLLIRDKVNQSSQNRPKGTPSDQYQLWWGWRAECSGGVQNTSILPLHLSSFSSIHALPVLWRDCATTLLCFSIFHFYAPVPVNSGGNNIYAANNPGLFMFLNWSGPPLNTKCLLTVWPFQETSVLKRYIRVLKLNSHQL